jgi:site-specific DNA-methyltransferase (adenine-specific)
MLKVMCDIVNKTNFDVADIITWKKKSALPNNRSSNKLTRIVEFIFVMCRKDEYSTFMSNKKLVSTNEEKNLRFYENIFNFVEAKNNDGNNDLNKATYSVELCEKLLNIYARPNSIIYDSFNGTGTTGVAALKLGHTYIGSEISIEQCDFSEARLSNNVRESSASHYNTNCVALW